MCWTLPLFAVHLNSCTAPAGLTGHFNGRKWSGERAELALGDAQRQSTFSRASDVTFKRACPCSKTCLAQCGALVYKPRHGLQCKEEGTDVVVLAEVMPDWLARWRAGAPWVLSEFFASRVVFYPGSGTDGQPVQYFGSRHCAHCFVYVDYGVDSDRVQQELSEGGHPFAGYKRLGHRHLSQQDLTPRGWVPHLQAGQPDMATAKPYAFVQVLERLPDFSEEHGPRRLAILFLGADGVASYDALFCQGNQSPPYAVVLQDHGFGGHWTRFGRDGELESLVKMTRQWPQHLLVADNTKAWNGYQLMEGTGAGGGGMWGYPRALWRRIEEA